MNQPEQYVNVDDLLKMIDGLPKVQQAAVHEHITSKVVIHAGRNLQLAEAVGTIAKARASWLYGIGVH